METEQDGSRYLGLNSLTVGTPGTKLTYLPGYVQSQMLKRIRCMGAINLPHSLGNIYDKERL